MDTINLQTNAIYKKKKKIFNKRSYQLYSMCLIPVILLFVFNYLPMYGIIIAFKNYSYSKGIFGSDWVGFRNFDYFFHSNEFIRITWNTLSMNFSFIIIGKITAIIIAILLFEIVNRKAVKIFQTLMITPHFMSWVIVSYIVYGFLNPQSGIINTILAKMNISPVQWYSIPELWPFILILSDVWKGVGMGSVIFYASLMGIDTSYVEAAEIDGANRIKIYWHVILPSLIPLVVLLTILDIGRIFRADFGLFYQIPRNIGMLYETTDVIDTYVFRTMRVLGDMGMSSAVGLMQSIVGFFLVIITNQVSKRIDSDCSLF